MWQEDFLHIMLIRKGRGQSSTLFMGKKIIIQQVSLRECSGKKGSEIN